ncbi:hypothetical protein SAMN00120144_2950 [Hymenobacter roseosalivarius DSM 11622]|uniref:Bacterial Pleckstrin homology domain-containing protein n=2 Tax=Hymenobacter roseosalivarius TaxID=89967 RepID=A0A1W1VUI4_9BACT|nr:hypothetical protein SAMN00120144_2950 [Hymenobacter roseosalivarius DSM 11622]
MVGVAVLQYSGKLPQKEFSWIGVALAILAAFLLITLRLHTRLDSTGLHYRMTPIHLQWQHIDWAEVSRAYVREYDPLGEYGGWGIKGVISNRAYNMAGSYGLQLELHNGNRVLLGTQQPKALRQVIAQLRPEQLPTI